MNIFIVYPEEGVCPGAGGGVGYIHTFNKLLSWFQVAVHLHLTTTWLRLSQSTRLFSLAVVIHVINVVSESTSKT